MSEEANIEIVEIVSSNYWTINVDIIDFEQNLYNIFYLFTLIKSDIKLCLIKGWAKEALEKKINLCEKHNLPFNYYSFGCSGEHFLCNKCFGYYPPNDYYYTDYKYYLNSKIKKIFQNLEKTYELIKSYFYPLFIKYYNKLEGNRKRRFEKNYNGMFKKLDLLKDYIKQLIEANHYNKIGIQGS